VSQNSPGSPSPPMPEPTPPTPSAPAPGPEPSVPAADPAALSATRTTIRRAWALKMALFWLALFGFGVWALTDILWTHPSRGGADAEYRLFKYLEAARDAQVATREALAFDDPNAELERLRPRAEELRTASERGERGVAGQLPPKVLFLRLEWLEALKRVNWPGQIPADAGVIDDPIARLTQLQQIWSAREPPQPLAGWDIPLDYAFLVVGFAGAAVMALVVLPKARRVYRWDPATRTLTLPDGSTITPEQVNEFDKRRWDKFFVTLVLGDGRRPVELDLYIHVPLEEWVLEMERVRFPEQAEAAGAGASPGGPVGGPPEVRGLSD
jgi:hypothetical protein